MRRDWQYESRRALKRSFPFGIRAHDYGRHTPAGLGSLLAATGASHIQLAPAKALIGFNPSAGSLSEGAAKDIAVAFNAAGLRISVLGCYVDLLADEHSKALDARARFLESLERAGALGAGCVATESLGSRGPQGDACPRAFLSALEALTRRAEDLQVNIAVEPVYSHRVGGPRAMAALLAELGSKRLYCLLDPVNLIDPREPDKALDNALACVELFADRIAVLHIKDYLPGRENLSVVPPGRGLFPYAAFFARASAMGLRSDLIVEDCAPEALNASLSFLEGEGAALVARH